MKEEFEIYEVREMLNELKNMKDRIEDDFTYYKNYLSDRIGWIENYIEQEEKKNAQ